METDLKKKLMSPPEVMEVFRIQRPTEIRWRKLGKLPQPVKIGRRVFYLRSDIEKIITDKGVKKK